MPNSDHAIELRPVRPEDSEFLYEVYASTRAEELAVLEWTDQERESFLRFQFEAQTRYWDEHYRETERSVIEVDGTPAGRLYLDRRPAEIRIVDIALLPEHRGHGIGRTLLESVLDEAREKQQMASIHVEQNNPALRLYRRLGFREKEVVGVYYLMEWDPAEPGDRDQGGEG